ncbi:MAG: hypothetical protein CFH18_00808 [Alphaproteobacteria bacterium MarineAlpha5_Bin8]|nr:MAG: hypothetical protein CFH17_01048 [Alphaproteobacteria bacterium MarineAlpha5_Bin7]PPR45550.1 MAG: hypothetical protein CFH18_00808 [Alphaproteobacteria bacterium MarineAlpha5_Bin8]PPR52902.1 MAG: hypothetical protein CFH16_01290 [Alphaproteobacteria bacterium MarineAlpha5_Bin6]|tara:strand:- start:124 stop:450 length:327 start_codon:yes stop_codon:yes gene_type:complete
MNLFSNLKNNDDPAIIDNEIIFSYKRLNNDLKNFDNFFESIKSKTDEELKKINALKNIVNDKYNFTIIKLKPAIDFLIKDINLNKEKDRLIYPMRSYTNKRSKINSLS